MVTVTARLPHVTRYINPARRHLPRRMTGRNPKNEELGQAVYNDAGTGGRRHW